MAENFPELKKEKQPQETPGIPSRIGEKKT